MEIIEKRGKRFNFHCQMCAKYLAKGDVYVWHPPAKSISGNIDMEICDKCARRELGTKNTKKWKELNGT